MTRDSGRAVWLEQACSYLRGADPVLAPLIELEDAERDSIIAQATELKGWPSEIDDQVLEEGVRVARAAAVLAPLEPRTFGAIYEIRTCTYGTGFMPQVVERWAEKIAAAQARPPRPTFRPRRSLNWRGDTLRLVRSAREGAVGRE